MKLRIGVLTISDRCAHNKAVDESGPNLVEMLRGGVLGQTEVIVTSVVADDKLEIEMMVRKWCDNEPHMHVVLTTGGTGVSERDVTPEATLALIERTVPGIPMLIFKRSIEITELAALSRGVAGIRGKTLIVNLPGSKKASKECLEAVARVIPHAVDLIQDNQTNVKSTHSDLQDRRSKIIPGNVIERPRRSRFPCVRVSEAQELVISKCSLLQKQKFIRSEDALGYVLGKDVTAHDFLPPVDVSLKDGYAVVSSSLQLERVVSGVSAAGDGFIQDLTLDTDCCVRVSTGSPLPMGADAVVQIEDTEIVACNKSKTEESKIRLNCLPTKGLDVRPKGYDFKPGDKLLKSGTYLCPSALGVLAAAGINSVDVFVKPVVAVLSTGDELLNPEDTLLPGKVRDSNRVTLINILKQERFSALDLGIAPDNPDALCSHLEKGFKNADVVVTSGSMSMGERDYLKDVLVADYQAEIQFGRCLMKPGKPMAFATLYFEGKAKFWFGLPGNPASAFVTSHLFLLPALRKISAQDKVFPEQFSAQLKNDVRTEDRPHYQRAYMSFDENNKRFTVETTGNQSSSLIASCINANSFVLIPPSTECQTEYMFRGSEVEAFLIGDIY